MKGKVTCGLVWTSARSNFRTADGDWAEAHSAGMARSGVRNRTRARRFINDLCASKEAGEREGEESDSVTFGGSLRFFACRLPDWGWTHNEKRWTSLWR